jgi:DNA repair protein RecN (Recombination protein N)
MLRRVSIENFLLIKDLEIEFSEGLNIISGETGTGKSMTISAIEFIMGRQGDYPEGTAVEIELEVEEEAVILRREIRGGRSRYFLDGRGTSARTVRSILETHVSLQGQNEFLRLLRSEFQREVVDRFGGLEPFREEVERLYTRHADTLEELEKLRREREELEREREFLEFRIGEVEELSPSYRLSRAARRWRPAFSTLSSIRARLFSSSAS